MKAKDMVWRSADGRTMTLEKMEIEHLHNLVMYLFRRMEEATRLEAFAHSLGRTMPEATAQGYPLSDWVKAGIKTLHRRGKGKYKESLKEVLSSPHYKGGV